MLSKSASAALLRSTTLRSSTLRHTGLYSNSITQSTSNSIPPSSSCSSSTPFAISSNAFTSTSTITKSASTNNTNNSESLSYDVIPKSDMGQYKEYSVIFTNRALNLMSDPFQQVMRDLNDLLKYTYKAHKVAIIPGSGTFGMEAVARQFATNNHCLVIRNGWFSYRWTEIFDLGAGSNQSIPRSHTVLKAQPTQNQPPQSSSPHAIQYEPHPIEKVVETIYNEKPKVLFAPHVETSTGMILPDSYIREAAKAMHDVGGLFVLDCIASGTVWADMEDLGVDVVISAPQKGWTGPACAALVMMSDRASQAMMESEETSFSLSLKRWSAIMDTYENGGFGYHTTMPTDALREFHEISVETLKFGIEELKTAQLDLGEKAHAVLQSKGLTSVAAPGFQSPGVLVYYSPPASLENPTSPMENPVMMQKFKEQGLQIAMGVPWKIDEPETPMKTFRMGLFGLDKLGDVQGTVDTMEHALDRVLDIPGADEVEAVVDGNKAA